MFPEIFDTRCIKDRCSSLFPIKLVKGDDEIVRPYDRHNNETVTLRKRITSYKNMRKWMAEFLSKFENHCIKIARVNLILITKFTNFQLFTLILYGVGGSVEMSTSLN